MDYYLNKVLAEKNFDVAMDKVIHALKGEGFGVLTQIDMQETLSVKLDVDFKKYTILGACNPQFAYKALQAENKVGVFLPCNVVVEENERGAIEVTMINPMDAMSAVNNKDLEALATDVQKKLSRVLEAVN
ncbi:MAG TPA: hypothetical protein DDX98_15400 [Bacteroidales bacterium]|jgi:uncharacterized protein (DUF302 family)|nr:hypothetical protein [Bacteroidales bacterium]